MVDDPRLEVVQLLPRRAAASVSFARYRDNDLGPYDEVVIAFLVRYHDPAYGARRRKRLGRSRGETGIYVHGLATTAALAVEAGQTIWGYPRFLADIEIRDECGRVACSLAQEGRHVMRIELREGGPVS